MKRLTSSSGGGRAARQPDLALLNENAVTIELDMRGIVARDPKGMGAKTPLKAKLFEKYHKAISEDVASALKRLWPAEDVKRSMLLAGPSGMTHVASSGAVSVYVSYDYSEGQDSGLRIKIIGERDMQARVAEEVKRIKSSYEL